MDLMSQKVRMFDMNRFEELLCDRKSEIGEDILSTLLSFDDLEEFKQMMLSFKREKHQESESLTVYGKGM